MSNKLPVVYLAFANALDNHLATLKSESRDIYKSLQSLQKQSKIYIHREESSQIDELYEDLLSYDQDIVIFHYGGHADGSMLQLEGGQGSAGGLAKLLGQQKSLKLVFLNGCATKSQVSQLHKAGVPAVIATSVKINDTKATLFATAFYQSLAKGQGIEQAFDAASALLETKFSNDDVFDLSFNRFPKWANAEEDDTTVDEEEQGLEWALYIRSEAHHDLSQWRLTNAQSEWQVQLRDLHGPIRSVLDDQPLVVAHKTVPRTLPAGLCTECGSTLLGSTLSGQPCSVCGSNKVETGSAATVLPDQLVEFVVTEKQAQKLAKQILEDHFSKGKASAALKINPLSALWIPYWKFNAGVHSEFEGESGFAAGLSEGIPTIEWRSAKNSFDTSLNDNLVVASKVPWAHMPADEWDFSPARNFETLDASNVSLLVDTNIEEAFGSAAQKLDQHLQDEISERLGGLEQKNVHSKTRYDQVTAKLIWLPHWIVSATHNGEKVSLLINGQTGAMRIPRAMGKSASQNEVSNFMNRNTLTANGDSQRATLLTSIFSGIGIGIMVGLLMGLAAPQAAGAKSIVSIFIGAVGVALAAMLGLNDRHFSVAKGLRIGSFGLAVTFAALAGIYVRDHGLLSPNAEDRIAMISRIIPDLSDNEKLTILAANYDRSEPVSVMHQKAGPVPTIINKVTTYRDPTAIAQGASGGSYLFSQEVNLDGCTELQNPYEQEISAADIIGNFKQVGGLGWAAYADNVEFTIAEADRKPALFAGRDAVCGFEEFSSPVILSSKECEILGGATGQSKLAVFADAFHATNLDNVYKRVSDTISVNQQAASLQGLIGFLCHPGGHYDKK